VPHAQISSMTTKQKIDYLGMPNNLPNRPITNNPVKPVDYFRSKKQEERVLDSAVKLAKLDGSDNDLSREPGVVRISRTKERLPEPTDASIDTNARITDEVRYDHEKAQKDDEGNPVVTPDLVKEYRSQSQRDYLGYGFFEPVTTITATTDYRVEENKNPETGENEKTTTLEKTREKTHDIEIYDEMAGEKWTFNPDNTVDYNKYKFNSLDGEVKQAPEPLERTFSGDETLYQMGEDREAFGHFSPRQFVYIPADFHENYSSLDKDSEGVAHVRNAYLDAMDAKKDTISDAEKFAKLDGTDADESDKQGEVLTRQFDKNGNLIAVEHIKFDPDKQEYDEDQRIVNPDFSGSNFNGLESYLNDERFEVNGGCEQSSNPAKAFVRVEEKDEDTGEDRVGFKIYGGSYATPLGDFGKLINNGDLETSTFYEDGSIKRQNFSIPVEDKLLRHQPVTHYEYKGETLDSDTGKPIEEYKYMEQQLYEGKDRGFVYG
jgi:hypothetical protein